MILPIVTLLTDRNDFAPQWQSALDEHDVETRICATAQLEHAVDAHGAVVIDVSSQKNSDNDELLAIVGFVRAHGALAVVHADTANEPIDDVVEELCAGLIARNARDVKRVADRMPRRLDRNRAGRFEFVSVAPAGNGVLAVLGTGRALILPRPFFANDDQTPVIAIELSEDAGSASITLQSGQTHALHAEELHHLQTPNNGEATIQIEVDQLGARLRELRLAAGLTQAELARRTGIHRPNIARVEAGRHTPSLETLSRIATAIGVPATQVLVLD